MPSPKNFRFLPSSYVLPLLLLTLVPGVTGQEFGWCLEEDAGDPRTVRGR